MPGTDIASIIQLGAPVLCNDTCTVLDLMRDPTRDSVSVGERQYALALLGALESGSQLVGLVADQVSLEFNANRQGVENETSQALARLKAQIGRVEAVASVYGSVGQASLIHLDDHVLRASAIADRWMKASQRAPQGPNIASRALLRLNQALTPAKKGKDSMKDCVVIETYLEAAAELRAGGLTAPIVFVSSNVRDYAGETGSKLKPDLAAEFANLGLEYAPNLSAAKHLLGL